MSDPTTPTPEQIAACVGEARALVATAHEAAPIGSDTAPYVVELVAAALTHRDARIAALEARVREVEGERDEARADLVELHMWLTFGCMPAEKYRPNNDAAVKNVDRQIEALRAESTRLRDLVRHQRGPLHDEGLITNAEYAALAADDGAVARLETYDAAMGEIEHAHDKIVALRAEAESAREQWGIDRNALNQWQSTLTARLGIDPHSCLDDVCEAMDTARAEAAESRAALLNERGTGIYVASRASISERPAMWLGFRNAGFPVVSTWIDEAGPGVSNMRDLWQRVIREVRSAGALVLYAEPDDLPLKGAFVEVGAALAARRPIFVVAPEVPDSVLGSWLNHPLVTRVAGVAEAMRAASATLTSKPDGVSK